VVSQVADWSAHGLAKMFHLKFVVNNRYNYDVQWITLLNTVNIFDRVSVRFNVTILYSLRDLKKNGELTSP